MVPNLRGLVSPFQDRDGDGSRAGFPEWAQTLQVYGASDCSPQERRRTATDVVRIRKPWQRGAPFRAQDLAVVMFQNYPCGMKWFWGSSGDLPSPGLLV